ncbi:MAG TPA: DUF4124 domain-containing protein [Rhodanobacteraceae bacterium]|nr:DUF4124 domain-containing protein [Rhodanobacteraceae bacterium]
MSPWPLKSLCMLALLACASSAHAQVYRCVGAQGEPVFSGEPCGTPAPAESAVGPAHSFAGICADSPQALQDEIAKAFTRHDVNRLAGLILWGGYDQASARATLQSLKAWLQQPLAGIAVVYATGPPVAANFPDTAGGAVAAPAPPSAAAPVPSGFRVSTTDDTRDFGITQSGGCWWLTF